ncbi:hypothetical protein CCACVL1_25563 [Corchorus capsularis]|uniref:Uncharacterized protein n=1 Tax=Corchorus capsularis TaxID=210143 RepID=A0A1R3GJ69_COCAP|nr:hypothetical protein CCACVL1_25563 [Corchorus capsularis]
MANKLRSKFRTDPESRLDAGFSRISDDLKRTMETLFQRQETYSQGSPTDVPKSPLINMPQASNASTQDTTHSFTNHSKLECPRFNGDDFMSWLFRIENFF